MPILKAIREILGEMGRTLGAVPPEGLERFVDAILKAERIYVAGGGRSGLMARAFAMRLMHLGLATYVVGETTTPSIRRGDLLLACSASGETNVTVLVSRVARDAGARVFAITATPDSPMARLADEAIIISAPSKRPSTYAAPISSAPAAAAAGMPAAALADAAQSAQYAGSLFEQALLVMLDAVSVEIGRRLGTPQQELDSRHANLE